MRKKPMMISEFFHAVDSILKAEGKIPAGIETAQPCLSSMDRELRTTSWTILHTAAYGSNEGIYLDLAIQGRIADGAEGRFDLGLYRTLSTHDEDMYAMAKLGADFYMMGLRYLQDHFEDFEWEHAQIRYFCSPVQEWPSDCSYGETVKELEDRFHAHYTWDYLTDEYLGKPVSKKRFPVRAVIRDMEKRKEKEIRPTKEEIKVLWGWFGDIPMDPETECLDEAFLHFPAGTHREDVWHWFEYSFGISVHDLMYGDAD